ncbi:hypothetical protein [Paraflavitalea speifideaquila]|uniref:hypothetical protein n=1 Tax=Paraflavitalea speifideaquila TaxID=3076558 RepID=UPI0028E911B5|nr:hypothetical protein [Paraflavitalea speifideiaquila]
MKSTSAFSWFIAVPALIMNPSDIFPSKPVKIEGNIIHSLNGRQVENAYVYIVSGEEEALSGKDGVFVISTWQQLPVTLVIEHPKYRSQKVSIKDPSKKTTIKLDPK